MGRTTADYKDALTLAHNVLDGHGRLIQAGEHVAWTFLLRTPEPVEDGIRKLLQNRIGHRWKITKQGRRVVGSAMTLNPDLVFDRGLATADVKYKLIGSDWRRNDLYQAIAFATIYETNAAAIFGFRRSVDDSLPDLGIGALKVRHVDWIADSAVSPIVASDQFVRSVESWVAELSATGLAAVS